MSFCHRGTLRASPRRAILPGMPLYRILYSDGVYGADLSWADTVLLWHERMRAPLVACSSFIVSGSRVEYVRELRVIHAVRVDQA